MEGGRPKPSWPVLDNRFRLRRSQGRNRGNPPLLLIFTSPPLPADFWFSSRSNQDDASRSPLDYPATDSNTLIFIRQIFSFCVCPVRIFMQIFFSSHRACVHLLQNAKLVFYYLIVDDRSAWSIFAKEISKIHRKRCIIHGFLRVTSFYLRSGRVYSQRLFVEERKFRELVLLIEMIYSW